MILLLADKLNCMNKNYNVYKWRYVHFFHNERGISEYVMWHLPCHATSCRDVGMKHIHLHCNSCSSTLCQAIMSFFYNYYSTSSLTNQIAPFKDNNVGYCSLQRTLWQRVMTPDDNFASFECRACVHAAQYSQWLSSCDRYR